MVIGSARGAKGQKPQTVLLHVDDLVPDPDQPRKTFSAEALSGLSRSLLETGQISPIVVRPGPEREYIIVVGERWWRAAKEAGVSHLECIVRYDLDDQKVREMQLAENYQREDIPVLEQAKSLKSYLDTYKVPQSELSRRIGIPPSEPFRPDCHCSSYQLACTLESRLVRSGRMRLPGSLRCPQINRRLLQTP